MIVSQRERTPDYKVNFIFDSTFKYKVASNIRRGISVQEHSLIPLNKHECLILLMYNSYSYLGSFIDLIFYIDLWYE